LEKALQLDPEHKGAKASLEAVMSVPEALKMLGEMGL